MIYIGINVLSANTEAVSMLNYRAILLMWNIWLIFSSYYLNQM